MSLTTREVQSNVAGRTIQATWRVLTRSEILLVAGLALLLLLVALGALPGLRPGLPDVWQPGATYAFWDALHPAAAWALRIILAAGALLSLVRLADLLWPMLSADSRAVVLLESVDPTAREPQWERLLATLRRSGWDVAPTKAENKSLQAVVTRPLPHRALVASLYLGCLGLVLALSLLWRGGWASASPALVLGEPTSVATPVSWRVALREIELLHEPEQELRLAATQLWVNDGAVPRGDLRLGVRQITRHRGLWLSVAQDLPAARIVALDEAGSGLELYPMVGSRPASLLQRVAFGGQEEHLFALPEAHLLVRSLFVGENAATCCIQVQVLDGLQGDLLEEVFLSEPADLRVGDITLQLVPERGVVLALWHTPGIGLAVVALLLVAGGAVGHQIVPPRRFGMGLVQAPEQERWLLYMAATPQALASGWLQRLRLELAAEQG